MKEERVIYTVGSSTREKEEFLSLLKKYGIQILVDVRRFPISRFEHFKKENLSSWLEKNGFKYLWLGKELGGYRKGGYETYTQKEEFKEGIKKLELLAKEGETVVMCAERLPWRCHRLSISRTLQRQGWEVVHILDEKRVWKEET